MRVPMKLYTSARTGWIFAACWDLMITVRLPMRRLPSVMNSWADIRGLSQFSGWVGGYSKNITRTRCRQVLTGLRYRRQLYEVSTGRMRDWDPLWILIRLERYYCLWKAISDISETSQRILEARILEKLSLRAIAQELNLTQREVKTRYEAACNVVRTRFLRYCTEKVEF